MEIQNSINSKIEGSTKKFGRVSHHPSDSQDSFKLVLQSKAAPRPNFNDDRAVPGRPKADLYSFLREYAITDKTTRCTHTSMDGRYGGKWHVPLDKMEKCLTLCAAELAAGRELHLTEIPLNIAPLRVDVDYLAAFIVGLNRQYTEDTVAQIFSLYAEEILAASEEGEELRELADCVVLEKSGPRPSDNGKGIKDGLHLHFVNFLCTPATDQYLRSRVLKRARENGLFRDIKTETPLENILDKIWRKPWLVHGATKGPGKEAYKATYCFDGEGNRTTPKEMFKYEMVDLKGSLEENLPRLLSVRPRGGEEVELTPQAKAAAKQFVHRPNLKKGAGSDANWYKIGRNAEMLDVILANLGEHRFDEYDYWTKIVWFGVANGVPEEKAREASLKSGKHSDDDFDRLWEKADPDGTIRINTLIHWMQEDIGKEKANALLAPFSTYKRPELPRILKLVAEQKPAEELMLKSPPEIADADVLHDLILEEVWNGNLGLTEIFEHAHGDDILVAGEQYCVYREEHGVWEQGNKRVLSGFFTKKMDEILQKYKQRQRREATMESKAEPDEIVERNKKLAKAVLKQHKAIQTGRCFSGVHDPICNAHAVKGDKRTMKKLDANKKLFRCANGVIDLSNGVPKFRASHSKDFLSFSCGVDFTEFDADSPEVMRVEAFFKKVFPNPRIRNYFLDVVSSCLEGGNCNKIFVVNTGPTNAGKSKTLEMVEAVFGDYAINFPRELMLRGRGGTSSGPRPELARAKNTRIATLSEIGLGEKLDQGVLKNLSGNDAFYARTLHDKGAEIKPTFTLFLQCNSPPEIPDNDKATWGRIRVVDYQSRFDDDAPESLAEQERLHHYKADKNLDVSALAPALLWLLVQRFAAYKKGGLHTPNEVNLSTNKYKASNDTLGLFLEEKTQESKGKWVSLETVWRAFKFYAFESGKKTESRILKKGFKEAMLAREYIISRRETGLAILEFELVYDDADEHTDSEIKFSPTNFLTLGGTFLT